MYATAPTPDPSPQRLAYSVSEAAFILGIGRSFLYEELRQGRIKSIRRGRRRLILAAALTEYLEEREKGGVE